MSKLSNYEIMNSLYPKTPPTWDKRISTESKEFWDKSQTVISGPNFMPLRNEIFNELINRIALTIVNTKAFVNPLAQFKAGMVEYGDVIQEIGVDVVQEQKFEGSQLPGSAPDQFRKWKPDVQAAYHRINRESVYPITIEDPRMRRAFIEPNGLSSLIMEIVSMLDNSNTIDEYIYCKRMFKDYLENKEYPVKGSQVVSVPSIEDMACDGCLIKEFVETVKTTMRMMTFPNRQYTSMGQMTQTRQDNMSVFLTVPYTVKQEVHVLSQAFNPEYLNINVPIIGLDSIDDDGEIIGVIADNSAFRIYDTLRTTGTSDNALGLYKNMFMHIHQIYMTSPFKNIVFLKAGPKGEPLKGKIK